MAEMVRINEELCEDNGRLKLKLQEFEKGALEAKTSYEYREIELEDKIKLEIEASVKKERELD